MTDPIVIQTSTKPWLSKTYYAALVVALAGFIPGAPDWLAAHPQATGLALGALFAGLRTVTKGKISIQ